MDWGNAFVRKIEGSSPITSIEIELNLGGDFKKTKKKITWLGEAGDVVKASSIPVTLLDYDYLITKKKLEEDDDVKDCLTPQTEFRTAAIADANVRELKQGDIIQFERKGFYIVDQAYDAAQPQKEVELIFVPDGRAASIASKYVPPAKAGAGAGAAAAAKPKASKKSAPGSSASKAKSTSNAATSSSGFPELAPTEPVSTTLLSDGTTGYEIPYKTKMYRVKNPHGNDGVQAPAKTEMFKVKPVHER